MQASPHSDITVAADSEETVRGLSAQATADGVTIRVLVEADTGGQRCGVQTPEAARTWAGWWRICRVWSWRG